MQITQKTSSERRLTILLAEHDPANQQLARTMLEDAGHDVTIVEDGERAIKATTEKGYDVILIDMQMPGMDGFDAAAAIRLRERITGAHRPIVALIGPEVEGEREKCLEARIDAHVSMPLTSRELLSVLDGLDLDRSPVQIDSVQRPAAVDIDLLMENLGGDRELLAEVVGLYRQETPKLVERIREGLAGGNALEVEQAAHRLKGSLIALAAAPAGELAHEVESAGQAERLDDAAKAFESLERALFELEQGLSFLAGKA